MRKVLSFVLCLVLLSGILLISCDNGAESVDTSAETTSAEISSPETTVDMSHILSTPNGTTAATSKDTSATTSKETTASTSSETTATAPNGYKLFSDGYISFAYPENWSKTEGSVTLIQDNSTGNNITVAYEAKTDYYEDLTVTKFNSELKPVYEAMGVSISGTSVKHKTNSNDVKITRLSFTTVAAGKSMKQTALIFTVADRTYSVTITEAVSNTAVINTAFDSITALRSGTNEPSKDPSPETSDTNLPNGYKLFSNEYISFIRPYSDDWDESESDTFALFMNQRTGNMVDVVYEPKTDYYDNMTEERFNHQLKPYYENISGYEILSVDIDYVSNDNGLNITRFIMPTKSPDFSMKQTMFIVTVSDRTYVITIWEIEDEPELVNNIFNSLTALK